MTLEFHIRDLKNTDHLRWKKLWTSYLEFYETSVSDLVYKKAFENLLSKKTSNFQGLVAERKGEIVGLAHYLFHPNLWSCKDTCYLGDLFVESPSRGLGIGRSLIEEVSARATSANVVGVYWLTQEFNYKGRMLYDQIADKTSFVVYEKN